MRPILNMLFDSVFSCIQFISSFSLPPLLLDRNETAWKNVRIGHSYTEWVQFFINTLSLTSATLLQHYRNALSCYCLLPTFHRTTSSCLFYSYLYSYLMFYLYLIAVLFPRFLFCLSLFSSTRVVSLQSVPSSPPSFGTLDGSANEWFSIPKRNILLSRGWLDRKYSELSISM